jgi:hypothetical protein
MAQLVGNKKKGGKKWQMIQSFRESLRNVWFGENLQKKIYFSLWRTTLDYNGNFAGQKSNATLLMKKYNCKNKYI